MSEQAYKGRILVVDDNPIVQETTKFALGDDFIVLTAESGEQALAESTAFKPDLVLMDIVMEGMDGYETCRRLRKHLDIPIIFVSSHDTLEERMAAFDAGGDDFIIKPYDAQELLRKAVLAVKRYREGRRLNEEKESLHQFSVSLLRNINNAGALLSFMRDSLGCQDHRELAANLIRSITNIGLQCKVQMRYPTGRLTLTAHGDASPLEESVFDKCVGMGRFFQFKSHLIVNFNMLSVLVTNMPSDEAQAGVVRDNIATLAESAEAIAETIEMRKESAHRAEALQHASIDSYNAVEELRKMYRKQQLDTRFLLHQLIDDVEGTYIHLGLTGNQENALSTTVRMSAEQILRLFDQSDEFEKRFATILDHMGRGSSNSAEVWI